MHNNEFLVVFATENTDEGLVLEARLHPFPDDTLRFMQDQCDGYIEHVNGQTPFGPVDVWINEDPPNNAPVNLLATIVANQLIRGTAVMACHDDEGNTTPLPAGIMVALLLLGDQLEEVFGDPSSFLDTLGDMKNATDDLIAGCEQLLKES
jgi:hypothetical protein